MFLVMFAARLVSLQSERVMQLTNFVMVFLSSRSTNSCWIESISDFMLTLSVLFSALRGASSFSRLFAFDFLASRSASLSFSCSSRLFCASSSRASVLFALSLVICPVTGRCRLHSASIAVPRSLGRCLRCQGFVVSACSSLARSRVRDC